jgi:hypothetical protein
MVSLYKVVNNCKFDIQVLPRRPGDVESTVLQNVSPLMENMYSLKELLKRP